MDFLGAYFVNFQVLIQKAPLLIASLATVLSFKIAVILQYLFY